MLEHLEFHLKDDTWIISNSPKQEFLKFLKAGTSLSIFTFYRALNGKVFNRQIYQNNLQGAPFAY